MFRRALVHLGVMIAVVVSAANTAQAGAWTMYVNEYSSIDPADIEFNIYIYAETNNTPPVTLPLSGRKDLVCVGYVPELATYRWTYTPWYIASPNYTRVYARVYYRANDSHNWRYLETVEGQQ